MTAPLRMPRAALLAATASLGLAGCQMQTPQATTGGASTGPLPTGEETVLSESSETTTTVSEDGTRRSTETTSTSVSVDSGALLNTLLGAANADPAPQVPANAGAVTGVWTLRRTGGPGCTVDLRPKIGTRRMLQSRGCLDDTMMQATHWTYNNGRLVFRNVPGEAVTAFEARGKARFVGDGMSLTR